VTPAQCPRCGSDGSTADFRGVDDGETVWTIWRCNDCCFSWRDSEPASAIDRKLRAGEFALDISDPGRFPVDLQPSNFQK
jgi:hypothetical protein